MTEFLSKLPVPSRTVANESLIAADPSLASYSLVSTSSRAPAQSQILATKKPRAIPPYGSRRGWIPRCLEDFGDGGAYPELHVAQFPLELGRAPSAASQSIVALQTDEDGKIKYEAVIQQGLGHRLAIYSRPEEMKPKWSAVGDLQKPSEEESLELAERTQAALNATLAKKLAVGIPRNANKDPEYIKYTPSQQAPGHNSDCAQRIIRMVEAQVDPLEPPKFKHKRVPGGPPSPPPAILHSPPRKLTAKDQADWRIPPCISNWKNQKGFTIPLDKRLAADGRALQDVSINEKFAGFKAALETAEKTARAEVELRKELVMKKRQQEETIREQQLRDLAARARAERAVILQDGPAESASREAEDKEEFAAQKKRQEIEKERRREVEREMRLERAGKKGKRARDEDRDISEKVALGQAKPTVQEGLFDSRLFNQSAGMDSGYNGGDDDKYDVYDKPLFVDRSKQSVYRYERERMEQNVGNMERMPAFSGADSSVQRTAPVEFEKDVEDPFGLDSLMESSKKRKM